MTDIGLAERGSGSVRMTEKGYEDFLSELSGELLALAALGRVFKKDCYPDEKTLSDSQGVLIRFGEKLEEFGFAGTTAIKHLEVMCEELYQLTIHQDSDIKTHLADMFCQLEEKIRDSVQITPPRLCIVAILKNEASYIREWLAYHRLVGVDRFILYDNESDDGLHELIDKLPPKYDVIYNPWPGEVVQLSAYNDALKRYRYSTDQMAFIDADEYIVPVQHERLVPDILD